MFGNWIALGARARGNNLPHRKPKFGPLSAPERTIRTARKRWGRYDSGGKTLYLAREAETAFAEVLSPFKRQLASTDPLEKDAAELGLTRSDFLEIVSAEWNEEQFMGMGAVPQQWRVDRCIYQVNGEGDGWWIDVEHPDSLAVLEEQLEPVLIRQGIKSLTTAVLRGENRIVTTAIGAHLRHLPVLGGSPARGLQFGSKHGGGWCRAAWLPGPDDSWTADFIATSGEPILVTNEHLARASERFRIKVF
nr:RES domain-containing protein [Frigoribacterium sp. RIT-PI-h]